MKLTVEQREEILNGAREMFFAAMLAGYASEKINLAKISAKILGKDGYKTITFLSGNYKVVDRYCVTPLSDFSAGTTTIFHRFRFKGRWIPVWWMSYSGHYPKEVIPFLKVALKQSYEKGEFAGGRGPKTLQFVKGKSDLYENHWVGDFHSFDGCESINCNAGFHKYFGMALI